MRLHCSLIWLHCNSQLRVLLSFFGLSFCLWNRGALAAPDGACHLLELRQAPRPASPSMVGCDEGEPFSIRKWVHEDGDSWMFITARESMREALKPILSLWIDTAIKAVLEAGLLH